MSDRARLLVVELGPRETMPRADGIELLRSIKWAGASIQVVMITADGSVETVKTALIHDQVLEGPRPVTRQDLEDTAQRALAGRQTELGPRPRVPDLVEDSRPLAGDTR